MTAKSPNSEPRAVSAGAVAARCGAMASGQAGLHPWRTRPVTLAEVTPEVAEVATYHLRFTREEDAAAYACRPGQFNMLYLPGIGETPISVSGHSPAAGTWAHTIRTAGNVTRAIERLQIGESLGLRGPFGASWPVDDCRGRDVIIVAGGIGLAPLRPALRGIAARRWEFGRVTLIHGARSPESLLFPAECESWTEQGIDVQTTVDRAGVDWRGNIGVATLLLDRLQPLEAARTAVWMCGPEVMMRYAVRSALWRGLVPGQIYVSLERNMQCAVGLCGHCQLGPEFICKDGPVFRYDRVAPYLRVENF